MRITQNTLRQIIKEELEAVMSDQDKLKLGNELLRLRKAGAKTEDGFEKNYHMTDFEEFFRVVKQIEKLPQSEDELYDAYMYAKSKQNGPMNETGQVAMGEDDRFSIDDLQDIPAQLKRVLTIMDEGDHAAAYRRIRDIRLVVLSIIESYYAYVHDKD